MLKKRFLTGCPATLKAGRRTTMVITIYNSKDKEQRRFKKATFELAVKVLDGIKGKKGWYAIAEYDDGDEDVFHYVNGEWMN